MKVLFFLLDGETNASSRHRVLQYFSELRRHGIQPFASRPVPEAVYQRFVEGKRPTLAQKAAFYSMFLACRARDVLRAGHFDVVVIQRDLFPFGPPWLEHQLVRRNPRMVYDTDDATYLRPGFTPNTPFQRLRRFDKVAEVVTQARWVSAATRPIADWAAHYNANVSVVPMAVGLAEYDRARTLRQGPSNGPLVIGWAGTGGGLRYLEALAPALAELISQQDVVVRVISGGYRDVCLPGVHVESRPWRPARGLAEMAAFDIGLVPLHDSEFERAKFPFKLLQYLALGVPVVSARVGLASEVIRHGENGLLATSLDEWRDHVLALVRDSGLRKRLATAGRESVAANYTVERVGPLLVEGLLDVAA